MCNRQILPGDKKNSEMHGLKLPSKLTMINFVAEDFFNETDLKKDGQTTKWMEKKYNFQRYIHGKKVT